MLKTRLPCACYAFIPLGPPLLYCEMDARTPSDSTFAIRLLRSFRRWDFFVELLMSGFPRRTIMQRLHTVYFNANLRQSSNIHLFSGLHNSNPPLSNINARF